MVDSLLSLLSISAVVKGQVFGSTPEPPQGASRGSPESWIGKNQIHLHTHTKCQFNDIHMWVRIDHRSNWNYLSYL